MSQTGRAAHAARTKRHAQHTPLPPRGTVKKESATDASILKAAGKARCPQCRKVGAAANLATHIAKAHPQPKPTANDATLALAKRAAEMIAAGRTQREVAAELSIGEGKTGTSRVRRLLALVNGKRTPRVPRAKREPRSATTATPRKDGMQPQPHTDIYDVSAVRGKGKNTQRIKMEGVTWNTPPAWLEKDGYRVTITRRPQCPGCTLCVEEVA